MVPGAGVSGEAPTPLERFVALSAALTGFRAVEVWGTGQARAHLDLVLSVCGDALVARLLAADPRDTATLLADADLGPIARNVIVLWYLGQWDQLPRGWRERHGASPADVAGVASAAAFRAGLVWPAIGSHATSANPPGFGSWATPPVLGS
jgi:hypothetical protein